MDELGLSLNADISCVKGVGKERQKVLNGIGVFTVQNLLEYFPRDYIDRSKTTPIAEAELGEVITIRVKIDIKAENTRANNKVITKLLVRDKTGQLELAWFNQPYLRNLFALGTEWVFTGTVVKRLNKLCMECDEFEQVKGNELLSSERIVPVYRLTGGLSQKLLRGLINDVLKKVVLNINDFLPYKITSKLGFVSRSEAILNIHFPKSDEAFFQARRRLVFEELFLMQLALVKHKGAIKGRPSVTFCEWCYEDVINQFPFGLTDAQKKVLEEIRLDTQSGLAMNRLVQGDVGSGKTAVAMLASFVAIKNGGQAALMAPTEVLASQHYESFISYFSNVGIDVILLSGSLTKKQKEQAYEKIADGTAKMIIGTHAIIQEKVLFNNLTLVITDEQHRFGVRQRGFLSAKGLSPHVLVMSATPIPRTLALVLYGDMDISVIDQLPPGRQPIETYSVGTNYRQRIYAFMEKQIALGRLVYVICPMIEKSEEMGLVSAVEYSEQLTKIFTNRSVCCLHGKMKAQQKQEIMESFAQGQIDVLVSTTVIEVGINVPNATVMIIENAERFGLSQLHQLRGRVGRGSHQSYCIMITDAKSSVSKKRMKAMTNSNDGFVLAELDLSLRGAGDFFGTRQHGLPEMKLANLYSDLDMLNLAKEAAEEVCSGKVEMNPLLEAKINTFFVNDYSTTL